MQMTFLVPAIAALLAALFTHVANDFGPLDSYAPPTPSRDAASDAQLQFFSGSYYDARALFRRQANAARATLVTQPLEALDATIDFALLPGARDRVVVHISGTHGVEGFAGSAIQSALLARAAAVTAGDGGSEQDADPKRPTIILVHALNAYGFAQLRRFNEHNVDLNRNFLTPENFTALTNGDPNAYGYMDVFDVLNPSSLSSVPGAFWAKAAYYLATKGFARIKRATVSGNYQFPKSIFYGGRELQPSLRILRDFLTHHVELDKVHSFGLVDVHTGLGAPGTDTLLASAASEIEKVEMIFGEIERSAKKVVSARAGGSGAGNDVAQGYDGSFGFVIDGVAALLPPQSQQCSVLLAQEFGTVAGPFVLKALSEENFVFHAAPSKRLAYAEKLRDVFYLHKSVQWKRDVLARGLSVFDQVYTHVGTC